YQVRPDYDAYQSIQIDDIEVIANFRFDGRPISDSWTPLKVYSRWPKLKKGDFWGCYFCPTLFAVAPEIAQRIITFLDQSCELLPVELESGGELYLCNVTNVVNCLNSRDSQHKPGLPFWITKYVFNPRRFDFSLFMI